MRLLSTILVTILAATTSLLPGTDARAGWPAPPETAKSDDEVFSYFEKFKGCNSRLEWARFSREQGEVLVVWQFFWYAKPLWASVTAYRHGNDGWHRVFEESLLNLTEDISVELNRHADSIIIRDAGREIKRFEIDPSTATTPKPN